MSLIHHFLENSAKVFPNKTALIHEDIRASYSEINYRANRLANWLINKGIVKQNRVVIILENSIAYIVSYYGILKSGAVTVPISTDLKPDSLRSLLMDIKPEVIISAQKFEKLLKKTDLSCINLQKLILLSPKQNWGSSDFNVISLDDLFNDGEKSNPGIHIDEDALASIIYTSGSEGRPKGVMLSHKNIISNTASICEYLDLKDTDIQMAVLPFCYVMGKSLLNTHFAVGGTVVVNNKFAFPAAVIRQMVDEKVTGFSGVPSTYAYLLNRSPLRDYRDRLTSLRYCSQAGGHMSRQVKSELRRVLPEHTKIFIMYGATEASARLTYLEPNNFEKKIDSIGKAIPNVSIKILDQHNKEVKCGETGELVASGPNIMKGYWNDPAGSEKVLSIHGYHTGDFAFQDEDGYFFLQGRKDTLLKVGGHRISPQEIEDKIMETGLVIETAVVGVPDHLLGKKLVALAVAKNGETSEKKILKACTENLPKHKMPKRIKLLRMLPKNASGKIDREKCLQTVFP